MSVCPSIPCWNSQCSNLRLPTVDIKRSTGCHTQWDKKKEKKRKEHPIFPHPHRLQALCPSLLTRLHGCIERRRRASGKRATEKVTANETSAGEKKNIVREGKVWILSPLSHLCCSPNPHRGTLWASLFWWMTGPLLADPWNLHVGEVGRRLEGKHEWLVDAFVCICVSFICVCVSLKHAGWWTAGRSLYLCVITAALCACMPALKGGDAKCAVLYNYPAFSFQQTFINALCIISPCNKHFKTHNEISSRYNFDWEIVTPGCLKAQ